VKILFISHYFPPEVNAPANRTFEHAKRWVADGHEVTVITGVPNHPKGEIFPGYRNAWMQEENLDGIRVIRTWMYLDPRNRNVSRSLNYVLFLFTVIAASEALYIPELHAPLITLFQEHLEDAPGAQIVLSCDRCREAMPFFAKAQQDYRIQRTETTCRTDAGESQTCVLYRMLRRTDA